MSELKTEGLEELESIFSDVDPQLAERRKQAYEAVRQNQFSSFPSDISILTAFDEAIQCFGLVGQIRNYYRYGTYNLCGESRKKLWFAIRNGTMTEKKMDAEQMAADPRELERQARVQQFYKDRLMKQKLAGSSEDVWKERETLLSHPFRE